MVGSVETRDDRCVNRTTKHEQNASFNYNSETIQLKASKNVFPKKGDEQLSTTQQQSKKKTPANEVNGHTKRTATKRIMHTNNKEL